MPPAAGMPQDFHLPYLSTTPIDIFKRSDHSGLPQTESTHLCAMGRQKVGSPRRVYNSGEGLKSAALSKRPGRLPIPRAWRLRNGRSESYPRLFVSSLGIAGQRVTRPFWGRDRFAFACLACLGFVCIYGIEGALGDWMDSSSSISVFRPRLNSLLHSRQESFGNMQLGGF